MKREIEARLSKLEERAIVPVSVPVVMVQIGQSEADALAAAGLSAGDDVVLVRVVDASKGGAA